MSNNSHNIRNVFIVPDHKDSAISLIEPDDCDNITEEDRELHDLFANVLGEHFDRLEEGDDE